MNQTNFKDDQFFKIYSIQGKAVEPKSLPTDNGFQSAVQDLLEQNQEMMEEKCYVVAFFDHQVLIGTYQDKTFSFYNSSSLDEKYLNHIRIFNSLGEIYLWKDQSKFWQYRIRLDEILWETQERNLNQVLLTRQYLWGTQNILQEKWLQMQEDRGMKIVLPEIDGVDKDDRVSLISYYYIDYNDKTHQAGYVDCRFVDFKKGA